MLALIFMLFTLQSSHALTIKPVGTEHVFVEGPCDEVKTAVQGFTEASLRAKTVDIETTADGCRADVVGTIPLPEPNLNQSNCYGYALAARRLLAVSRYIERREIPPLVDSKACKKIVKPVPGALGILSTNPARMGKFAQHGFIYISPIISYSKPYQGQPITFEVGPKAPLGGEEYARYDFVVDYYLCTGDK